MLHSNLTILNRQVARRLALTREQGGGLPRLEILAERFSFDKFEKLVRKWQICSAAI
jgi:hypothetical protein